MKQINAMTIRAIANPFQFCFFDDPPTNSLNERRKVVEVFFLANKSTINERRRQLALPHKTNKTRKESLGSDRVHRLRRRIVVDIEMKTFSSVQLMLKNKLTDWKSVRFSLYLSHLFFLFRLSDIVPISFDRIMTCWRIQTVTSDFLSFPRWRTEAIFCFLLDFRQSLFVELTK